MEHGTLRALKEAEGPNLLPAPRALAILRAVSDALFPLHAAGRAYGAFGPDSIILDGTTVRLAEEPTYDELYAAPELRDGGDPTPASDAFAYGVLAHRMLAGDAPVFGADGVPKDVAEQHPDFPAFAAEALTRALQLDPGKRPLPKVLDTLLQVVPAHRWPSAAPAKTAPVEREQVIAAPPTTRSPALAPAEQSAETSREARNDEFLRALTPGHAVPDIGWTHDDAVGDTDTRTLIDWTSDADPTRPSPEVPEIRWTPAGLHGADPLTDELPAVVLAEAAEAVVAPAAGSEVEQDAGIAETIDDAPTGASDDDGDDDEVDVTGVDIAEAPEAPEAPEASEPDPLAALWAEGQPAYQPTDELTDLDGAAGSRVRRSRRRRASRFGALTGAKPGEERLQKLILGLVLVVLLAAGLAFALANRGAPPYDPTLHGASRNLSHVSPLRS